MAHALASAGGVWLCEGGLDRGTLIGGAAIVAMVAAAVVVLRPADTPVQVPSNPEPAPATAASAAPSKPAPDKTAPPAQEETARKGARIDSVTLDPQPTAKDDAPPAQWSTELASKRFKKRLGALAEALKGRDSGLSAFFAPWSETARRNSTRGGR